MAVATATLTCKGCINGQHFRCRRPCACSFCHPKGHSKSRKVLTIDIDGEAANSERFQRPHRQPNVSPILRGQKCIAGEMRGTRAGYGRCKCRCDDCRGANTQYMRELRAGLR